MIPPKAAEPKVTSPPKPSGKKVAYKKVAAVVKCAKKAKKALAGKNARRACKPRGKKGAAKAKAGAAARVDLLAVKKLVAVPVRVSWASSMAALVPLQCCSPLSCRCCIPLLPTG